MCNIDYNINLGDQFFVWRNRLQPIMFMNFVRWTHDRYKKGALKVDFGYKNTAVLQYKIWKYSGWSFLCKKCLLSVNILYEKTFSTNYVYKETVFNLVLCMKRPRSNKTGQAKTVIEQFFVYIRRLFRASTNYEKTSTDFCSKKHGKRAKKTVTDKYWVWKYSGSTIFGKKDRGIQIIYIKRPCLTNFVLKIPWLTYIRNKKTAFGQCFVKTKSEANQYCELKSYRQPILWMKGPMLLWQDAIGHEKTLVDWYCVRKLPM